MSRARQSRIETVKRTADTIRTTIRRSELPAGEYWGRLYQRRVLKYALLLPVQAMLRDINDIVIAIPHRRTRVRRIMAEKVDETAPTALEHLAQRLRTIPGDDFSDRDLQRALWLSAQIADKSKSDDEISNTQIAQEVITTLDKQMRTHKILSWLVSGGGFALPTWITLKFAGPFRADFYAGSRFGYFLAITYRLQENFNDLSTTANNALLPLLVSLGERLGSSTESLAHKSLNREAQKMCSRIVWGIGTDIGLAAAFLLTGRWPLALAVIGAGRGVRIAETIIEEAEPDNQKVRNRLLLGVQLLKTGVEWISMRSATSDALLIAGLTSVGTAVISRTTDINRRLAAEGQGTEISLTDVRMYLADILLQEAQKRQALVAA